MNTRCIVVVITFLMLLSGFTVLIPSTHASSGYQSAITNSNDTVLYEFQLNNTGSSFTDKYFPFTFTNESLFDFNTTDHVVQNVKFLYSNGTQIKGFIPTGNYGLPNTDQGSGKWLVYLSNFSMTAGQKEDIYMQVFPATESVLNANFSTNTGINIGFYPVNFSNKNQVWIHTESNSPTITTTSTSFSITGPKPSANEYIVYSANISVNMTISNNFKFYYQYTNAYDAVSSPYTCPPSSNLNNVFGDYSTGNGAGFQTVAGETYVLGLWHNLTGYYTGTGPGSGNAGTFTDNGSYINGVFSFSGNYITSQSMSLSSVDLGGLIQAYFIGVSGTYAVSTTTLSNLAYWGLSQSGITQKNIGTVTSISPTSTGNYILFNENGLPFGQSWNVSLTNKSANVVNSLYASTTNNVKAFLPTGYNYTFQFATFDSSYYKIVNASGSIFLSPKANATVNITLTNISYDVVFHESGLISGNSWGIGFNGTDRNTTSTTLTFIEKNGTYTYTVLVSTLYNSNVSSGTATVNGAALNIYIGFTYHAFNITFSEVGLPSGVQWSMTINGTVYHSNLSRSNTLLFQGKAGSYAGIVNNASYYTPVSKYFNFTISGNAQYTIDYGIVLTFIETGYNGVWHITIDGVTYSSSTNTIVATVVPGLTQFNVWGVSGYTINPEVITQTYTSAQTIRIAFTVQPASFENVLISTPMVILYFVLAIISMVGVVYWRLKHGK